MKSNGKVHQFYEQAYILPSVGNRKKQKSIVRIFEFPSGIWMTIEELLEWKSSGSGLENWD
jgi:hypothetical protein